MKSDWDRRAPAFRGHVTESQIQKADLTQNTHAQLDTPGILRCQIALSSSYREAGLVQSPWHLVLSKPTLRAFSVNTLSPEIRPVASLWNTSIPSPSLSNSSRAKGVGFTSGFQLHRSTKVPLSIDKL